MEYVVAALDLKLSNEQVRNIIAGLITLVISIALHEFGHAIVADKLGDRTPRSQGRVTLNPAAHADPIGTLLFPIMAMVFSKGTSFGFGWGKPVEVMPVNFTRSLRMRTSHMLVAAAGPAMNVVLALIIGLVHAILLKTGVLTLGTALSNALWYAVVLNFILFFFNLIPAKPLDGGTVLEGFLPDSALDTYRQFSVYGPFLIMAVILIPGMSSIFVKPALWCSTTYFEGLKAVVGFA